MLQPKIFDFYTFGQFITPLSLLPVGSQIKNNVSAIEAISTANVACIIFKINEFCKNYLPSAAQRSKDISNLIKNELLRSDKGGIIDKLSEENSKEIQRVVHAFQTALEDDLSKLPVFVVDDEKIGNFSIAKLLKGASNGYPLKTKEHLTPQCIVEIDEAGKCLVYERSTAAGFHMLRSVELTIRQYLLKVPGFTMPPLNRQNWGEYLKLLSDNGTSKDVTDHLHNIKANYRNPLMHPEDTLEIDDAVSLFGIAQSMNEMLIADMKKRGFIK